MRGKVLEYEAKTILREGERKGRREGKREGRREGRREGILEGKLRTLSELVRSNKLSIADASSMADMPVEEFNSKMGMFCL